MDDKICSVIHLFLVPASIFLTLHKPLCLNNEDNNLNQFKQHIDIIKILDELINKHLFYDNVFLNFYF
jgi:hypothetical protein